MHIGIAAIVYAPYATAARDRAERVFGTLCDGGHAPFCDVDPGGWSAWPEVALASSPEGSTVIAEAMDIGQREFMRNLLDLRAQLRLLDDEAAYRQGLSYQGTSLRRLCFALGQYRGSNVRLYDHEGEGIREPGHLADALSKWPSITEAGRRLELDSAGDVWVFTASAKV